MSSFGKRLKARKTKRITTSRADPTARFLLKDVSNTVGSFHIPTAGRVCGWPAESDQGYSTFSAKFIFHSPASLTKPILTRSGGALSLRAAGCISRPLI